MKVRKLKTRIHFNRVNMQRGNKAVWTAHNSRSCNQARKIIIMHNGEKVAETVYNPLGKQPRAYFLTEASVTYRGNTAIVKV